MRAYLRRVPTNNPNLRTAVEEDYHMSSKTNAEFFANLLNQKGLTGVAAEIGVYRGDFSVPFLAIWEGEKIHLVDRWNFVPGQKKGMHGTQADLEHVLNVTQPYRDRCNIWQLRSLSAAQAVKDGTLDFAYIDAAHGYDDVLLDLRAWWWKVKEGGVMAGHDYRHSCGVPKALFTFAQANMLTVTIVPEVDAPKPNAFWYICKEQAARHIN